MAREHIISPTPKGMDSDAYDAGFESDTESMTSSIMDNVYENGRRYHGWLEGKYDIPNDEAEQDRMDLQHYVSLLALKGRLYKSPTLKGPTKILDLGTGNGAWAMDCGEFHPEAQVIGVDLSPIQPRWVPENVSFEVDDIEGVWTYRKNTFDFVHIRQLSGFINDWPKLYKQAMRILKPGGVLEIKDMLDIECDDGTLPENSCMVKWNKLWKDSIRQTGRELPVKEHPAGLAKAGFEDITYSPIKIPVGTWPRDPSQKELGFYQRKHIIDGCESISLGLFSRSLGWKKEEIDAFLFELRKDIRCPDYHSYSTLYITYGRKPLNAW